MRTRAVRSRVLNATFLSNFSIVTLLKYFVNRNLQAVLEQPNAHHRQRIKSNHDDRQDADIIADVTIEGSQDDAASANDARLGRAAGPADVDGAAPSSAAPVVVDHAAARRTTTAPPDRQQVGHRGPTYAEAAIVGAGEGQALRRSNCVVIEFDASRQEAAVEARAS